FRPADSHLIPRDQTIVCRCVEVSAGVIRRIARQTRQGPNQMKAFTRCGMGPCQGRQCGITVAAIIADEQGRSIEQVGYYRVRPPLKPVSLGQVGSVG
ncbi:MAG: (2Fe-2S)-binding protein, partial [Gammaproteobacteria bacterium]